ncbi:MAG: OprO/OprP family phosphate-selective porin [Proteobacteria bacterium]|nr:OprO/OprP family phosphate-selective porin [Pseudomonadota bacterium]MBU1686867.1 OprO/OprP family phosphate-selective porin [Pseudomonadota bacterium]
MNLKKFRGTGLNNRSIGKYCTPFLALALLACPVLNEAQAGPTIEFGENGEGILKIDYKAQAQIMNRDTGSGLNNEEDTNTMRFRRNRLAFMGAWGEMYGIYVQADYFDNNAIKSLSVDNNYSSASPGSFSLLDYQIRIKFNDMAQMKIGKFKANFARENLEDCYQPLTLDRSLFLGDPFVISRDVGVALWGNLVDDKLQYRVDFLEGKSADRGTDTIASDYRFSGRVHLTLLDPEKGYGYRGTYRGTKKVLTIGAALQHEPNVVYLDSRTKTGDEDYWAATADIYAEIPMTGVGTVTLSAAYMDYDYGDRPSNYTADSNASGEKGEREGYYVKAAYMLPNLPLQFFGRMENWTFAELNGVIDHELDWMGVGLNYYIKDQSVKMTLEYSTVGFDERDTAHEDFATVVTQFQYIF